MLKIKIGKGVLNSYNFSKCPRHFHLSDGTAFLTLATRHFGMNVADGLPQILMSPIPFLIVVDGQRPLTFRTQSRFTNVFQVEMQHLHAIVESTLGGFDGPIRRFYT